MYERTRCAQPPHEPTSHTTCTAAAWPTRPWPGRLQRWWCRLVSPGLHGQMQEEHGCCSAAVYWRAALHLGMHGRVGAVGATHGQSSRGTHGKGPMDMTIACLLFRTCVGVACSHHPHPGSAACSMHAPPCANAIPWLFRNCASAPALACPSPSGTRGSTVIYACVTGAAA